MKTKLLLVDDHAVVRSGLRMLLDGQADVCCWMGKRM